MEFFDFEKLDDLSTLINDASINEFFEEMTEFLNKITSEYEQN